MGRKQNRMVTLCAAAISAIYLAGFSMSDHSHAGGSSTHRLSGNLATSSIQPKTPSRSSVSESTSAIHLSPTSAVSASKPTQSSASKNAASSKNSNHTGDTASSKKKHVTHAASSKSVTGAGNSSTARQTAAAGTKSSSTVKHSTGSAAAKPASASNDKSVSAAKKKYKYRDGTFSGEGSNWNGMVGVKVAVKQGKITSVKITKCTTSYPEYLIKHLPSQIIHSQSAKVDNVSGATYSTGEFQTAVKNALHKALRS